MSSTFAKRAFLLGVLLFTGSSLTVSQSSGGRLFGKVTDKDGKPLAGVTVVITNQTTGDDEEKRTGNDGEYATRLGAGAYRIRVAPPYEARFERGKAEYGGFSNVICDEGKKSCPVVENVIIGGGIETRIDFVAESTDKPATADGDGKEMKAPIVDHRTLSDRWRLGFPEYERYGDKGARGRDIPFKRGSWFNPYEQNVLKGDRPVIGNEYFMILSGVSTSTIEIRRTPSATSVSSNAPGENNFLGRPESLAFNQVIQLSFEFFKGQTVFRPRQFAIKISPTFSVPNYLNARETGIVNIDVRRGTNRTDLHASLEEAFVEAKLFDVNDNYDFVSVRAGIQPFTADFRGFLYSDNNLGTRLFGGFSNNKSQFNIAYFRQFEKDTNSGLNNLRSIRNQDIYIANFFRQDFLFKGYTIEGVGAYNEDRADTHYDANGFLVRPALIGSYQPHTIRAGYVGVNGDGHIGFLNLSNSYYYAFGRDTFNPIAGHRTDISAHMAAVEASIDRDYLRFRGSFFWASGDKNPTDDKANGFDAILDDPNFIGGQFSYWNRQGIRLVSTDVGLNGPNSLLPSLRSSKIEGQANFVNPGVWIYNLGADVEVTQTLKAIFNANYLRFDRTESLEYVLFDPRIRHEIGYDISLGVVYRPFLINNITFTFGGNVLLPGRGFKDIYTNRRLNCPIPAFCDETAPNPNKPQYTLFSQLKLIF